MHRYDIGYGWGNDHKTDIAVCSLFSVSAYIVIAVTHKPLGYGCDMDMFLHDGSIVQK